MRALLMLALLSGCAPMVLVTREQRPDLMFSVDQQPVVVKAQETGVVVLDALSLFSDQHWREVHAAASVGAQLYAAGIGVAANEERAKSQLTVTVREDDLVVEGDGTRVAKVVLWIEADGVTLSRLGGTARGTEQPGRLYTLAIEDAATHVPATLQPTTQQDFFRVEKGDGLAEANEKLLDGDLPGAIAAYQARLEKTPGDVAALLNLSTALFASGDLGGATQAAQRAADADTTSLKRNRKNYADDLVRRAQKTTRVVEFTTYGAAKKK